MEQLDREDLKKALRGQTIHQFDRKNVRELIKEINKKLEVVELTYGVKIKFGRFRFDGVSFKSRVEGSILSNQDGLSADKIKWDQRCSLVGLKKTDFGKKITFMSGRFAYKSGTICGINVKAKTYPVLIKMEDGIIIKSSVLSIVRLLK
jgi:hypothetical protein